MFRRVLRSPLVRDVYAAQDGLLGRYFSASVAHRSTDELKHAFADALPREQDRLKNIKKQYGDKELHPVTVNMCIGGMRGITGLLYETSLLDAEEGIRFRGHSIPELQVGPMRPMMRARFAACRRVVCGPRTSIPERLMCPRALQPHWPRRCSAEQLSCARMQKVLPTAPGGTQPLPEGLLWLLLTGDIPTEAQVKSVTRDLMARSSVPPHVMMMLRSLPPGTHPMTQLSMAVLALQPDSVFARQYQAGAPLSGLACA
jgi:citrate synthase